MEIHQVVVSAAPFDAITSAALEIRHLLRLAGRSDLFAHHVHPQLVEDVLPLGRYTRHRPDAGRDDLLVFHASIGEPPVFDFLMERPERLVVVYHNISPAEYFRPFDPAFAGLLEAGRAELQALAERAVMAIAVSEYNAAELRRTGFRDVRVAPLMLDAYRLAAGEPDEPMVKWLAEMQEGPAFLYVGQFLPHKRPDLLLQAFHVLCTYVQPEARLFMAGAGRLPRYFDAVRSLAAELSLGSAHVLGPVTDEQLAALYSHIDVFVTASEHEGFCAPIIEAMFHGAPVVARACAAIPETTAGAAMLVPPEAGPLLLAEAMAELASNSELRTALVKKGKARARDLHPDVAGARFLEHLLSVA